MMLTIFCLNVDYLFKKFDLHLTVDSFRDKKIDVMSFNAETELTPSSKRGPYLWKRDATRKRGETTRTWTGLSKISRRVF